MGNGPLKVAAVFTGAAAAAKVPARIMVATTRRSVFFIFKPSFGYKFKN